MSVRARVTIALFGLLLFVGCAPVLLDAGRSTPSGDQPSDADTKPNLPPIAVVGPNQTVPVGERVTLDGFESYDPEGVKVSGEWRQSFGTTVALEEPNTPNPSFVPLVPGVYAFTLTVTDDQGLTDEGLVFVTAFSGEPPPGASPPQNRPPVPLPQDLTTHMNAPIAITLLAADPDADTMTYTVEVLPLSGTVSGEPPDLIYTPASNYVGTDIFSFAVADGRGGRAVASIRIVITALDPCAGQTIVSGQTAMDTIVYPGGQKRWTFCGMAGERVLIAMAQTERFGIDPSLRLYPPSGGINEATCSESLFGHCGIDHELEETGSYSILAASIFDRTGSFDLTFLNLSGALTSSLDMDGGPIAAGETWIGRINANSDMDAYTFNAEAGQRVSIRVVGSFREPVVSLYSPGGNREAYSGDTSNYSKIDHQLLRSGRYTIVVFDRDRDLYTYDGAEITGEYALSLEQW